MTDGLTEDLFDLSADVVVVGSGAAATAAAATAANEGAEVLLLERAEQLGGTTALSGCGAWVPNNSYMRAEGYEDPRDAALRFMASLAYPHQYDPVSATLGLSSLAYELLETYYDRGPEAIDYLVGCGATSFFADVGVPDYFANHPENKAPYGRLLKPPERKIAHEGAAEAHLQRMYDFIQAKGGAVRTGHRVQSLLRNESGEVIGAEVHAGVRGILVRARKAFVFGTGGFLHNPEMRRNFLMGPTYGGCATPTAQGDFVTIAQEVGARFSLMQHAWWYQVPLEHAAENGHTAGGLFMPFGDSMLQVNRFGQRVINEKAPYNERGPVHFLWDGTEYPNLVLFSIFDDGVIENPNPMRMRFPVPQRGEDVNYVVSGETIEDLAVNIEQRLEKYRAHTGGLQLSREFVANLKATIERFNGFARTGVDEEFGRGQEPISTLWSGPLQPDAKATMHPLRDTGPYHCVLLVAGALDTKGGPTINARSQVLDARERPVPGLYGAGNCVASPAGQAYWGPGVTIGAAIIYGYIAGQGAAAEPVKAL
ncbi:MAG TPA: FAD-dependent oxidoreductase [Ilumatobacter sp.]|nr:FAD-dependent oxidoreductase [Ilumatobacter sp.]